MNVKSKISSAASILGSLGGSKPKNYSPAERERRRKHMIKVTMARVAKQRRAKLKK